MLTKPERLTLEDEILRENKKAMRQILLWGEGALSEDKFKIFRNTVLNSFGKSGLTTEVGRVLDGYTDNK